MEWVNALSTRPSLEAAVNEVTETALRALQGKPDLGFVFISSAFASEYPRLMPLLQERLDVPTLIGCGGGGIVGNPPSVDRALEVEGDIALSLTLAHLPDVDVRGFFIASSDLPDLDSPPDRWIETVGVPPESNPQFILFADPFMTRINDLLQGFDYAYPGSPKAGGLSSSPGVRGSNLFFNDRAVREGAVGVALSGNIALETIVAQGCRPIGKPYRVAEGESNVILALDEVGERETARPPLEILRETISELDENDRSLAQNSLFIGVVRDEFKQTLEAGDFLIRNLVGVDPKVGAVAIGDRVRPGQRIQFHLRDANTSAEDLETLLQKYCQDAPSDTRPLGALMFACLGRGSGLYGEPNFDSRLFHRYLENVSLSGFFCNGEIGPVGGNTFLHGYTSVFGIFSPMFVQ
ncbi:MAG: FIST C-terminal domain-containing protein [Cyanobacteria bacterium SID2]|nr:FIST C-terminal domain-containing protein [Cyanobacteria bacterium SID2]MBP0004873.1 FIST C-terminal domain-containing protein [Cyanobacteria bacterium SBC]